MKLIIRLNALLLYISTINSLSENNLEKQIQSVLSKFEKTKYINENNSDIHVKVLKGSSEDYDFQKGFTENPKNALNNLKDGNAKDLYNKIMVAWKQKPEKSERPKQIDLIKGGKRSKDLVLADPMQPFIESAYHPDSGKVLEKSKPDQYLKKSSKKFLLAKSNGVVLELKPPNDFDKKKTRQDIDAQNKVKVILDAKEQEKRLNALKLRNKIAADEGHIKVGSVFNVQRRKGSDSSSGSSSQEKANFKDEFRDQYMKKKKEALAQGPPVGEVVNMAAARPWGVSCGDPNQHDMPWGTCMLAAECEPEYRIYRGDYFCGRTEFACCAIMLNNYDMYQGFDVSFDSKGMSTDSFEKERDLAKKKKKSKSSSRYQDERKERMKRQRKRKRKIKKSIRDIIKEIRKILNKQYRNATTQKKKKTDKLKKFVKKLKKQYKKDRQSLLEIHEEEMIKIDSKLKTKLEQIKQMNINFAKNDTFRDIVVNGTINKTGARMLVEAYPDLEPYMGKILRRSGDGDDNFGDYLEYDLEYGYLYY